MESEDLYLSAEALAGARKRREEERALLGDIAACLDSEAGYRVMLWLVSCLGVGRAPLNDPGEIALCRAGHRLMDKILRARPARGREMLFSLHAGAQGVSR